jgi:hypothetical protein
LRSARPAPKQLAAENKVIRTKENGKAQERFEQGLTLLHAAAAGGHTEIADLLLANGADPRLKTQEGKKKIGDGNKPLKRLR